MARRRPNLRKRPLRFWLVLAGIGVMAFLYYKPFRTYMNTRSAVSERRVEVARLKQEARMLERRLARSSSAAALERQARDLGYVRPGEHLFIVKGITAWRRAHHRATIAGNG
jgi:cell division protein FtsB